MGTKIVTFSKIYAPGPTSKKKQKAKSKKQKAKSKKQKAKKIGKFQRPTSLCKTDHFFTKIVTFSKIYAPGRTNKQKKTQSKKQKATSNKQKAKSKKQKAKSKKQKAKSKKQK